MREKRSRVVTSKPTRSGCRICRLRRIKCDETRPLCKKCISSGRLCSGYPPTGAPRSDTTTRQLLPVEVHSPARYATPSLTPDATDHERYAFDHFRRTTARQIHLNTPRARVTQLVLRLSLEIPVFRAIAALGSVHRDLIQITHVTSVHTLAQDHDTIDQYGRAVASLQRHIGQPNPGDPLFLEPVLCACILLASCEIVKNDTTAAISHLRFGRRISTETESHDPAKLTLKPYNPETASTLVSAFKLLEENYIAFGIGSAEDYSLPSNLLTSSTPLAHLESIQIQLDSLVSAGREVRTSFLRLAQSDNSQDLAGKSVVERYCIDYCSSRTVEPNSDNDLPLRLQHLRAQHASWLDSLNVTLDALDLHPRNDKTSRRLSLLQIQHFYSTFLLTTCRSAREVPTDIFHNEYYRILDLAEQYLNCPSLTDDNTRESLDMQTNFAVKPVILPALYLIALKCRDSLVRRRAIRLLASTDRLEGFQKSQSLATFAKQIVGAEERTSRTLMGLPPTHEEPLSAEQVPEVARFLDVVVSLAPGRPSDVKIVCGRFAFERRGELEVVDLTPTGHVSLMHQGSPDDPP